MAEAEDDIWEVVGGALEGGILVRTGIAITSALEGRRLPRGTLLRALHVLGNRLLFRRISGSGPETGWVSITVKDRPLLVRRGAALLGQDSLFNWEDLEEREAHEARRRARSLPPIRHHDHGVQDHKSVSSEAVEEIEPNPPFSIGKTLKNVRYETVQKGVVAAATTDEAVIPLLNLSLLDVSADKFDFRTGTDEPNATMIDASIVDASCGKTQDAYDEDPVACGFESWVHQRRPLLRVSPAFLGRAWDFPLSKSEKHELLLLHVAAGERVSADAARSSAEAAAFEAGERSRVEAALRSTARAIRRHSNTRSRFQKQRLSIGKTPRLSIGRKRVSIA